MDGHGILFNSFKEEFNFLKSTQEHNQVYKQEPSITTTAKKHTPTFIHTYRKMKQKITKKKTID